MSFYADCHIHSLFSGDSNESVENIINKAVDKGLDTICFTDHNDFDFYAEGVLYELDSENYFDTMKNLKDLKQLKINIGVEMGIEPDKTARIKEFLSKRPYDFVIGSSHLVDGMDPYYPNFFENRTNREALTKYFESIIENLKVCSDFDVYGHLDYVVRYFPNKEYYDYMDYIDLIDEILNKIISLNKGIEVNTSGYRSGLNNPNPCFEIVKRYKELGGEFITLGSDAHVAKDVGYMIKETTEKIKECGFTHVNTYENRIPVYHKI